MRRSCLSPGVPVTVTQTITWTRTPTTLPPLTSRIELSYTGNIVGGNLVATGLGRVVDGAFAGQSVSNTVTDPQLDLLVCATTEGQRMISGIQLLAIL